MIIMKRLVAIVAGFGLVASPAIAGLTQISGSGTGGNIATATTASGSGGFSTTLTASVGVGNLIVISVTQRGSTGTAWSCTDDAGSPGTFPGSSANTYTAGNATPYNTSTVTTVQTFYSVLTTALTSTTNSIKCTTGAAVSTAFVATAWSGNAAAGSVYDASAYAQSGAASGITDLNVGPTGTLAQNCSNGELLVITAASQSAVTLTTVTPVTMTNATGNSFNRGWYLAGSNAAFTWTPTVTVTAGAKAEQIEGFKAASCPSGKNLLTLGVGE